MSIEVVPTGGPLGAEVRGLDIRKPLTESEVAIVRKAWQDHLVIIVPGQQQATREDHMEFSRNFGELALSPPSMVTGKRGEFFGVPPEIAVVSNIVNKDGVKIGALGNGEVKWHTDSSFFEIPPAGSILRAIEVPETGAGGTGFLNMYMAYETLPADLKAQIQGKVCKHSANYDSAEKPYPFAKEGDPTQSPGSPHPLVRTHPETGRKCLFLGRRLDAYILGMTVVESDKLLDKLWAHATNEDFAWEHKWRMGDLVGWDNRCVMHRRGSFDASLRRHLERTQIVGDRPH